MATLVCPDVHERLERLLSIEERFFSQADRVVMLGDFFDAFGPVDLAKVGRVCGWINGHITDPKFTFLLGNHCAHYLFGHPNFKCSGYNNQKQDVIDANLPDGIREKFRIFTRVGPYLVSHAGFTEATLQYARPEVEAEALRTALAGGFDSIFGAGYARGGNQKIGGPTWLDWDAEFEHIEDCAQIVGHTNGKDVRVRGGLAARHNSYCLDTALRHIAWVDEDTGSVTIERVG